MYIYMYINKALPPVAAKRSVAVTASLDSSSLVRRAASSSLMATSWSRSPRSLATDSALAARWLTLSSLSVRYVCSLACSCSPCT